MARTAFTDEDQKRLDELTAKREQAMAERAEEQRAAEAKGFEPVLPLLKALDMAKIRPLIADAQASEGLSPDNRSRLDRIERILTFDLEQGLVQERDRLAAE